MKGSVTCASSCLFCPSCRFSDSSAAILATVLRATATETECLVSSTPIPQARRRQLDRGDIALRRNEIQFATIHIHPRDADLKPISQTITLARPPADQGVRVGFEVIKVVRQTCDVKQAVHRQLDELTEQAEILNAGQNRLKRLADSAFHMREQLDPNQVALRRLGAALGFVQ